MDIAFHLQETGKVKAFSIHAVVTSFNSSLTTSIFSLFPLRLTTGNKSNATPVVYNWKWWSKTATQMLLLLPWQLKLFIAASRCVRACVLLLLTLLSSCRLSRGVTQLCWRLTSRAAFSLTRVVLSDTIWYDNLVVLAFQQNICLQIYCTAVRSGYHTCQKTAVADTFLSCVYTSKHCKGLSLVHLCDTVIYDTVKLS